VNDNQAEHDYLAGLLELFSDDPDRARVVSGLVPRDSFSGDTARDVYDSVCGALAAEQKPTMSDLVAQPRYMACKDLIVDLIFRSRSCRFGYSLGVDRYGWQIRSAWKRRLVADAASDLQAAVNDPEASSADIVAATKAVQDAASNVENAERPSESRLLRSSSFSVPWSSTRA